MQEQLAMTTITISLPDSLKAFIDEQVIQEGYNTVSEYLRALLRNEQERRAQLRLESLLHEGLQSEATEMTSQDWADIREEVRKRQQIKSGL